MQERRPLIGRKRSWNPQSMLLSSVSPLYQLQLESTKYFETWCLHLQTKKKKKQIDFLKFFFPHTNSVFINWIHSLRARSERDGLRHCIFASWSSEAGAREIRVTGTFWLTFHQSEWWHIFFTDSTFFWNSSKLCCELEFVRSNLYKERLFSFALSVNIEKKKARRVYEGGKKSQGTSLLKC